MPILHPSDKIANRKKYQKDKTASLNKPSVSAELDTANESDIFISAEREHTLLDWSQEAIGQAQEHAQPQHFQGRDPLEVQNILRSPTSHSTPLTATTVVPATPLESRSTARNANC